MRKISDSADRRPSFALLLVGMLGFRADATVGTGAHSLPLVAKDYSPVEKTACRFTAVRRGKDFGVPPVLALLVRSLPLAASKRHEISLAARSGRPFSFLYAAAVENILRTKNKACTMATYRLSLKASHFGYGRGEGAPSTPFTSPAGL